MIKEEQYFQRLKKKQCTLQDYLKFLTLLASQNKGQAFDKYKKFDQRMYFVNPFLKHNSARPNLLFQYLSECVCSIFEAIDNQDYKMVEEESVQILEQIQAFNKTHPSNIYYQSMVQIQNGQSIFINYIKEQTEKKRKTFISEQESKNIQRKIKFDQIKFQDHEKFKKDSKKYSQRKIESAKIKNKLNEYLANRYFLPKQSFEINEIEGNKLNKNQDQQIIRSIIQQYSLSSQ